MIERFMKDWPWGLYYFNIQIKILENYQNLYQLQVKVLKDIRFIATKCSGSTVRRMIYFSFFLTGYEFSIHYVIQPQFLYKIFGSINEIDSHNKSSQSDIAIGNVGKLRQYVLGNELQFLVAQQLLIIEIFSS